MALHVTASLPGRALELKQLNENLIELDTAGLSNLVRISAPGGGSDTRIEIRPGITGHVTVVVVGTSGNDYEATT